jgi:hypothetical protein
MKMFWTFKLSFNEAILPFFGLATFLATFSNFWAFFSNLPVTLQSVVGFGRIYTCEFKPNIIKLFASVIYEFS